MRTIQPEAPPKLATSRASSMRRFGRSDEVAAAIAFLMSEDAAFITGQTLFVDGGASIGRAAL